jgi:hypothetical protein
MELSRKQKMLLHTVPASLGLNDEQRRMIHRNVGGFESAADKRITREGFIAVMAFYEVKSNGRLSGFTEWYWRDQDRLANPLDALRHRLRTDAYAMIGWRGDKLDAFIAGPHMSSGDCECVNDASAYWLRRCIEAVKAIYRRTHKD